VVFGGVKINPQMQRLRRGVDVLVATPGRLLDLYNQNAVKFTQLEVLVLDEADRMLDMGFIHDIRRILKVLPAKRQNLLFSATFSNEIRTLAKGLVHNPVEVSVAPPNTTAERVEQKLYPVDKGRKPALLTQLINENSWQQVLVFCRTKHGCNRLVKTLIANKIESAAIHGNKSQGARTKALAEFKSGAIRVLVATDIAARGLDIDQLPQVVNFDLPNVPEDYVHRIGRTGRAGASGHAVSLVCADEAKQLQDIERLIGQHVEREVLEGFQPANPLGQSRLDARPKKPKKPKQPKAGHRDGQRSGENARGHKPAGKNKRHAGGNAQGGRDGNRDEGAGNSKPARRRRPSKPSNASGNTNRSDSGRSSNSRDDNRGNR
jgi:ATP-dependent RNA helicase RhlE